MKNKFTLGDVVRHIHNNFLATVEGYDINGKVETVYFNSKKKLRRRSYPEKYLQLHTTIPQ